MPHKELACKTCGAAKEIVARAFCCRACTNKRERERKAFYRKNNLELVRSQRRKASLIYNKLHAEKRKEDARRRRKENPERERKIQLKWYLAHPDKLRQKARLKLGWAKGESERAESMLANTTECACCKSTNPRHARGWQADHDHNTGLFRSFLCHPCNIRLGFAEKFNLSMSDIEVAYLNQHRRGKNHNAPPPDAN